MISSISSSSSDYFVAATLKFQRRMGNFEMSPGSVNWPITNDQSVQMFMVAQFSSQDTSLSSVCSADLSHVLLMSKVQVAECDFTGLRPWHWFNFMMAVILLEFHPETRFQRGWSFSTHLPIRYQVTKSSGACNKMFVSGRVMRKTSSTNIYKPLSPSPYQEARASDSIPRSGGWRKSWNRNQWQIILPFTIP